ncbi:hypothetical protein EJ04DRAFT_294606 [Polyplosphaeria fusca]|uniref:Peptidase S8/S53 domain-containing protein n=1 Tax=Polyplosphaeria fusca TaxID=682080 RepID=A0A9P4RAI4_9PLEO|nr:hypothetical protein EJ04DRAFT_294606 [Polyplosphaeria fusca]
MITTHWCRTWYRKMSDAGLIVVTAAGNENKADCGGVRPGCDVKKAGSGINVGGVTRSLSRWPSSNSGDCISLWAPGQDIRVASQREPCTGWFSCWVLFGSDGYLTRSETSLSAPMTAGMVAYEMSRSEFKFAGGACEGLCGLFRQDWAQRTRHIRRTRAEQQGVRGYLRGPLRPRVLPQGVIRQEGRWTRTWAMGMETEMEMANGEWIRVVGTA